jgi:EAL domain-containing protein (putative c-di-GMP-specific phosphodiesterase class I)/CheY-like chemotaxis protein
MTDALGRAGVRTVGAVDPAATEAALAAEAIGCVVADLGMPGTPGIDLLRALRRRPETSMLPFILMTGSEDPEAALEAFDAGADDFLPKPVRIEELVARVRARLQSEADGTEVVLRELRARAAAIRAIGQLTVSSVPEQAAKAVVMELARRIGAQFVAVYRLVGADQVEPLASWNADDGLQLGLPPLARARGEYLVGRAREGPWVERLSGPEPGAPTDRFGATYPDMAASVPIHARDDLVGLLSIASLIDGRVGPLSTRPARLLASAIDYASAVAVVAGTAIAHRPKSTTEKTDLRAVLTSRRFFPVYQPIVALRSRDVVGYEALTRFVDGAPPDVRFARAAAVGLGFDLELAAIEAAVEAAPPIGASGFLGVNVSPGLVVSAGKRLKRALQRWNGRIMLEVNEHGSIGNREQFRWAVGRVGDVELSIDDAGAGYGSLRHIVDLEPAWVKLDRSLVHDIDAYPLRQALVAGLAHLAARAGPRLIAVGVEREAEAQTLLEIGVEFAQGYLLGRPERTKV